MKRHQRGVTSAGRQYSPFSMTSMAVSELRRVSDGSALPSQALICSIPQVVDRSLTPSIAAARSLVLVARHDPPRPTVQEAHTPERSPNSAASAPGLILRRRDRRGVRRPCDHNAALRTRRDHSCRAVEDQSAQQLEWAAAAATGIVASAVSAAHFDSARFFSVAQRRCRGRSSSCSSRPPSGPARSFPVDRIALVCRVGVDRRVHQPRLGRRRRWFTAGPQCRQPGAHKSRASAALSRSARSAGAQTAVTAGHAVLRRPREPRPDDVPAGQHHRLRLRCI